MFSVLNFIAFQVVWFSCVVGAGAYGLDWVAVAALLALIGLAALGPSRRSDFLIASITTPLGFATDVAWVWLGILDYPHHALTPYWIAFLWLGVGLSVNHSLAWFRDRPVVGALIVGIFAPVTYLAGQRFGAVAVNEPYMTIIICLAWMGIFALASHLARRLSDSRLDPISSMSAP